MTLGEKTAKGAGARQRGMTMVELLVALVLGMAVLIALASVYIAAKRSFGYSEASGRMVEDGNYALDTMSRYVRMAGFAGCVGVFTNTVTGPPAVTTYYPTSGLASGAPNGVAGPNPLASVETGTAAVIAQPMTSQNFIRGWDSVQIAMFSSGAPAAGSSSSLLVVGGSMDVVSPSVAMVAASDKLTLGADPYAWQSKGVLDFIVSDCNTSSLFRGQVATNAGVIQVDHTTTNNATANFPGSALYGPGAMLMPLEWRYYYLDTRSGATFPSLYVITYDGNTRSPALELVANVEAMKIYYGENTLSSGGVATMQPDTWRTTAATVSDWSKVVAVRIGLIMVSADTTANSEVTASVPTLLGAPYTPPTGAPVNAIRKEFSTTVILRNRVGAR